MEKESSAESLLFGTAPSFIKSFISRRNKKRGDIGAWLHLVTPASCSIEPTITWIGHATFLIQLGGVNILTDPVFGDLWLFKRQLPPGIAAELLPAIDLVLLSHNHHDHMNAASLYAIQRRNPEAQFSVPLGDKRWFDKRRFARVSEHMWWDEVPVSARDGQDITCTFLPAAHWSRRGLFDMNKSLWGSWMISWRGNRIYFAGDTAYSDHFSCIENEFSSIDIALMPIGPCEPRTWMKRSHLDAHDAGQAFLDLNAQHFVPMHWGTFDLGTDHFSLPIDRLVSWWQKKADHLKEKQLHVVKVGEPRVFKFL